jgi:hypothetical protein
MIIIDTNLFIEKAYNLETSWAYEQTNKHNEVVWSKMEKAQKAYDLATLKKQFPFLFK